MSDETTPVTFDEWALCRFRDEASRDELEIDLGRLNYGVRMMHRRCGYEVLFPHRSTVKWPDLMTQAARHLPADAGPAQREAPRNLPL